jgi:hypothetical protein
VHALCKSVQSAESVLRPLPVSLHANGRVAYPPPPGAAHVGHSRHGVGRAVQRVSLSLYAVTKSLYAAQAHPELAGRWPYQESDSVQDTPAAAHPDAVDLQDDGRYLQDARQCLQDALHSLADDGLYWYLHSGSTHARDRTTYLPPLALRGQSLSTHLDSRVMNTDDGAA